MSQEQFSRTQPILLPGKNLPPSRSRRPLYWLAGAIVLAGLGASYWYAEYVRGPQPHPESAQFRALAEPRLELIEGLQSYESETPLRQALEAAGYTVQRRELKRPPSAKYPPRQMVTLTVDGYRHLQVEGQLGLEFFNDRLMEVDFRPDDPAAYAPRLHRLLPGLVRGRTGHAELRDGELRVWANVDLARSRVGGSLRTEALVLWQDLRLIRQRDDWDARFSQIPPPAPG